MGTEAHALRNLIWLFIIVLAVVWMLVMLVLAGAILRRRSARIVQGRVERGYTDAFELICRECGDHPYLDYSEIPPRLQRIRGPYTMRAGLAACEKHLALTA